MTHFSVTSNGYAQLWPSSAGTPSTGAANSDIPSTSTPNNLLAVFWDDLVNVTGSTVKTITTGSAPNRRFTIEWADFTIYVLSGGRLDRLTFQAQLNETTNVIEYHYCTLALNGGDADRLSGNSATVGVENAAGTVGVRHSYNTAGSVSSANALRFTP